MTTPRLVGVDWGTTSLRAFLLGGDGVVLDGRAEPLGITRVANGGFAAALEEVVGAWRRRWPELPVIAAGMVGSAQGWIPAPYRPCPAGVHQLAVALVPARDGAPHVVPGVAQLGDRPDVMRGEETQVIGALALRPELAARARIVLPGTHSKWVSVADGAVSAFETYMTGELYAVLRDHSILGRPARSVPPADAADEQAAFERGVARARDAADGVAPLLFGARALVLLDRLGAAASLGYLSGLLIGDELRCGLAGGAERGTHGGAEPLALVGDAALCARYAAALRLFGVDHATVVDGAAERGLWQIAACAGLVARGGRETGDTGPAA